MKISRSKLFLQALTKLGMGFVIIGTILFLCAGSLNYINGWVFMLALFIPVSALGAVLLAK
ncbi:MAG: isoprenylcysteine carboxylmethyltransferase family protein, partial [Clostridiales bacterium]|nr:isoprenylcysteine carboxylmethyltransferase family protein [Clostridiales bacterium]